MALVVKDRVKEQTTTTGTGSVTLGGAVSGFQTFGSAVGNANTTYYAIVHQTADEWEVGLGTYTSAGTVLSRDTILDSSNSGSAVPFSAGTKDVFVTYAADKAIYRDAAGEVSVTRATSATYAVSAETATSATNATTAITATSATNASYALSATNANFAASATEATTAITATSATNASYALSATNANFAASATEATTAITATSATNASYALSATNANFAASATEATTAITATSATNASYALSATNANFAASATEATTAITATSATNATNAVNLAGGSVSATTGTFSTSLKVGGVSPDKQFEITKSARAAITSLTDATSISLDFDVAQNFTVTLGDNRTLENPSNIDPGQTGSIFVQQDGTGGRTLSFANYWHFAGGTAPTLSTAASAVDRIDYITFTSTSIHAVASLNVS